MGFTFGFIGELETTQGTFCFLAVIAFVLLAEFLIGFLEHLLQGSAAYNRMIQAIYKELMLMGLISFMILMYEADLEGRDAETEVIHEWILAIDFGHIVLFFTSIFYVMHSFMLMILTTKRSKEYFGMFSAPASEVIHDLVDALNNPYRKIQYYLTYWPVCSVREVIEFKLMSKLFATSYTLPNDFNFALYLSGCLEGYALKAVEVGMHAWLAVAVLVLLNFARVQVDVAVVCADEDGYGDDHSPTNFPTAAPTHPSVRVLRHLAAAADDHAAPEEMSECTLRLMSDLFLFGAALVTLYVVALLLAARVYEVRLLRQVGVSGPQDYMKFLAFSEKQRQEDVMEVGIVRYNEEGVNGRKELKVIIEAMLDDDEVDEEEEIYRHIMEYIHEWNQVVVETFYDLMGRLRTWLNPPVKEETSMSIAVRSQEGAKRRISTVSSPPRPEPTAGEGAGGPAMSKKSVILQLTSNKVAPHSSPTPIGGPVPLRMTVSSSSIEPPSPTNENGDNVILFGEGTPGQGDNPADTLASPPLRNKPIPNFAMSAIKEHGSPKGSAGGRYDDQNESFANSNSSFSPEGMLSPTESYMAPTQSFAGGTQSYGGDLDGDVGLMDGEIRPMDGDSMSMKQMRAKLHGVEEHSFQRKGRPRKKPPRNQKGPNALSTKGGYNAISAKVNPVRARSIAPDGNVQSALDSIREQFAAAAGSGKLDDARKVVTSYDANGSSAMASPVASAGRKIEVMQMGATPSLPYNSPEGQRPLPQRTTQMQLPLPVVSHDPMEAEAERRRLEQQQQHIDAMVAEDNFMRQEEEADHQHTEIFFLRSPNLFFRAVDIGIMLHSVYLAIWATCFVTIVGTHKSYSVLYQMLMVVPALICFPCIALTIKICSQLNAVVFLDLKVIGAVLEEQEDMEVLKTQLRDRIVTQISSLTQDMRQQRHFVHVLFWDIDTDKSNTVDIFEFRQFLKLLRLNYSDKRFHRLFRAIDIDGDMCIGLAELDYLIFPDLYFLDIHGRIHEKQKNAVSLAPRATPKRARSMLIR